MQPGHPCIRSHQEFVSARLALAIRVSNTTGQASHRDLPLTVTVPVVTAPITVRVEPQQLRLRDAAPGVCRVAVSNAGTNRWAQVQLTAADPEQVVRATWSSPLVQVPPGGEESVQVRFDAPPPEPGDSITLGAGDRVGTASAASWCRIEIT